MLKGYFHPPGPGLACRRLYHQLVGLPNLPALGFYPVSGIFDTQD